MTIGFLNWLWSAVSIAISVWISSRLIRDIAELRTSEFYSVELIAYVVINLVFIFIIGVLWFVSYRIMKSSKPTEMDPLCKVHLVHIFLGGLSLNVFVVDLLLRML